MKKGGAPSPATPRLQLPQQGLLWVQTGGALEFSPAPHPRVRRGGGKEA